MRRAIIFLNGDFDYREGFIKDEDSLFCADGGANHIYKLGLIPELILGDLDSIKSKVYDFFKKEGVKFEKYPCNKDRTDTEILIDKIYNDYNEIIIFSGMGRRLDHTLININLLEKYPKLKFITKKESLEILGDTRVIKDKKGTTISIIPFSKKVIINKLNGFKYDGENMIIKKGDSLGISNIIEKNKAQIDIKKGKLILVIND